MSTPKELKATELLRFSTTPDMVGRVAQAAETLGMGQQQLVACAFAIGFRALTSLHVELRPVVAVADLVGTEE